MKRIGAGVTVPWQLWAVAAVPAAAGTPALAQHSSAARSRWAQPGRSAAAVGLPV